MAKKLIKSGAHANSHGEPIVAVRNDTVGSLVATDGEWTPLQTDSAGRLRVTGQYAEDTAHSTGDVGNQMLSVRQDTASALGGTDGDYQPLITDANGRLHTLDANSATMAGAVHNEDDAHTSTDPGIQALAVRNDTLAALAGTDGDYSPFQVNASGALYVQEGAAMDVSAATVTVTDDGSFTLAANDGVDIGDVDVASIAAGSNTIGQVGIDATTNTTGASMHFDSDGDNTAQVVKASAGNLYSLEVSNPNSADAYLQLFDVAAGSVTVGTTTPDLSLLVPAGDGTKDGAMDKTFTVPVKFGTAITYACTTTPTGNGDPTTGLIVNATFI